MDTPAKWPGRPEVERLCLLSIMVEVRDPVRGYVTQELTEAGIEALQDYLTLPKWRQKARYDWLRKVLSLRKRP